MSRKFQENNLTFRSVMCDAVIAERKAGGVSTDLFKLARRCKDSDEFIAKCDMEEEWVLSSEAGPNQVTDIPRCWVQSKSDIKGAMKAGVDLTTVTSYHKMKEKKVEVRKQAKEEKEGLKVHSVEGGKPGAKPDPEAKTGPQGVEAKVHTVVPLPPELIGLVKILDKLPELPRKKLLTQLEAQAKSFHDLYFQAIHNTEGKVKANG